MNHETGGKMNVGYVLHTYNLIIFSACTKEIILYFISRLYCTGSSSYEFGTKLILYVLFRITRRTRHFFRRRTRNRRIKKFAQFCIDLSQNSQFFVQI